MQRLESGWLGLAQVHRQVRDRRHGRYLEVHLDHPATVIAGVVDHMHQHRAGAHGAAFARYKRKFEGFIQRCIGLAFAPVAVPVIDLPLRPAQLGKVGMQQIV